MIIQRFNRLSDCFYITIILIFPTSGWRHIWFLR